METVKILCWKLMQIRKSERRGEKRLRKHVVGSHSRQFDYRISDICDNESIGVVSLRAHKVTYGGGGGGAEEPFLLPPPFLIASLLVLLVTIF